jgi:hypothetical protein
VVEACGVVISGFIGSDHKACGAFVICVSA